MIQSNVSDPYLLDSHKALYHPERITQWMNAKTIEDKMRVFPDRKSTRLNSSHIQKSRMPSSA